MPRKFSLYQVDAFTTSRFAGNPAGVVTNADGLTDIEMQKIARELNNSETAFILRPKDDSHDLHVRYFTPTREVPICGHATIAAHYVRAVENSLGETRVTALTGAGILPVDILRERGDYAIVMTQGKPRFEGVLESAVLDGLLRALGLAASDLPPGCPVEIVSTGHSKVMIGVADETRLHALRPDMAALTAISNEIGCNGYYAFTLGGPGAAPLVHGRMFAPAIGINEDPVTGNANGPLGAYLVHHNLAPHDGALLEFDAVQGEAMGRPGTVHVRVAIKNGEPELVQLRGNAVIVFAATLRLDAE